MPWILLLYQIEKNPKYIKLATAIEEGASAIIANDRRWRQVKEIKTIILGEYV